MILEVGTPIFKKPTTATRTDTLAILPDAVAADATVFVGVTRRTGEDTANEMQVQSYGTALVRVKGPVVVGDSVGAPAIVSPATLVWPDYADPTAPTGAYLVVGGQRSLGVALQPNTGTNIKLTMVNLGAGGGSGTVRVSLCDSSTGERTYYLMQGTLDPDQTP